MSKAVVVAHSPGPWSMAVRNRSVDVLMDPNPTSEVADGFRLPLYGGEDADGDAVRIANCRLVTAAPDLLAACKQAAEYLAERARRELPKEAGYHKNAATVALEAVTAAIAKATDPAA